MLPLVAYMDRFFFSGTPYIHFLHLSYTYAYMHISTYMPLHSTIWFLLSLFYLFKRSSSSTSFLNIQYGYVLYIVDKHVYFMLICKHVISKF